LLCPSRRWITISGTAFAGHLDGVGVAELVWREAATHSRRGGDTPQLGACCGG